MSWVSVAVAGAGVLTSAYSSNQAASAQQRAMSIQQSALAQDQAFRQQQYADYQRMYGPMEQQLVQQASSEQPLNLGPTWGRIQQNFDQAGRNNTVNLARSGMLGSGLDTHNNLENARAYTLSDAFSKGLMARDALRQSVLAMGKQMPQQAGFASQGNQQMAGLYGQQAGLYGNLAAGAAQGFGSSLGALGYALGNYSQAPPPTVDARTVSGMDWGALSPIGTGSTTVDPSLLNGPTPYPTPAPPLSSYLIPGSGPGGPVSSGNYTNYLGNSPLAGSSDT